MVGEFEVVLLQKCVTDCVSIEACDVVVVECKVRGCACEVLVW
jgi:hypothetical protein